MDFTIAVVDDDTIILFLHKKIIQKEKLEEAPHTFNSAKKALDFFDTLPDDAKPILLFLDINMPVMNGWDLLEVIHQDGFKKEIHVVMVTSSVDASDKEKAFSYSKVIDFVEKPLDDQVLQRLKLRLLKS
ncbi:response regulator [Flavobacterium sp. ZS1P14]|uniref:response regulator n=1 Tax=Flavobacterium sp. ZS1P14 TaxID=3401729 RepID=UPI003AADF9D2